MEYNGESRKSQMRKRCLELLKKISEGMTYKDDKIISSLLYDVIQKESAEKIMLYIPLGSEANVMPLIKRLRQEGRTVYVPYMEGESFRLLKYRYPLYRKRFGIKEPLYSRQYRPREIDLAIIPVVGMDATYRRLGFGKGMYDRFFEKEHSHIKKVIFVARRLCYSREVVTDHYDVRADLVIAAK
jgi:5-formyltetrahydrofolate cyclo-ligase